MHVLDQHIYCVIRPVHNPRCAERRSYGMSERLDHKTVFLSYHLVAWDHTNFFVTRETAHSHRQTDFPENGKSFVNNSRCNFEELISTNLTYLTYSNSWMGLYCTAYLTEFCQLTYWGRVTHTYVDNLTIISSDNGLSPGRRQAIIWATIGILATNVSENLIKIFLLDTF